MRSNSKRRRTGGDVAVQAAGTSKQTVLRTFFASSSIEEDACPQEADEEQPVVVSSLAWCGRHYECPAIFMGDNVRHPSAGGGCLDAIRHGSGRRGLSTTPASAAAGPAGWQARNMACILSCVTTSPWLCCAVPSADVATVETVLALPPCALALLSALYYAPNGCGWNRLNMRHAAATAPSFHNCGVGDDECRELTLGALTTAALIDACPPAHEVAALLAVGEADAAAKACSIARNGGDSRTAIVNAVKRASGNATSRAVLAARVADVTGPVVRLRADAATALARIHRLVFVLGGYSPDDAVSLLTQDISALGLQHLTEHIAGMTPPQKLRPKSAAVAADCMHSAASLIDTVHSAAVSGDLDAACTAMHEASCSLMATSCASLDTCHMTWALHRAARAIACRALLRGIAMLERARRYTDAAHYAAVLLTSPATLACDACNLALGEAALRRCLDLEHAGAKDEALTCAETVLQARHNGTQVWPQGANLVALARIVTRLAVPPRRWKASVGVPTIMKAPEVKLTLRRDASTGDWLFPSRAGGGDALVIRGVEAAVLEHYSNTGGWDGSHTENGPWAALFTLLFHDIIMDAQSAPGTWLCPLADGPLDFGAGVAHRRAHASAARCEALARMPPAELAHEVLLAQQRISAVRQTTHRRGVGWPCSMPSDMLPHLAAALGGLLCSSLCHSFASGYDANVCGFPDLILWRELPSSGRTGVRYEFKLLEVKGPGDSLSDRQRSTLSLLTKGSADVAVCYVAAE